MNQTMRGTKVPVNLALDANLVDEAATLTPDLSETVETLLTAFIARERLKRGEDRHALDVTIAWLNEIHEKYGLPGADFSPL
jgi:hypothetical protein